MGGRRGEKSLGSVCTHSEHTYCTYGFALSSQAQNPVLFRMNSYHDPFRVCPFIHEDSHSTTGSLEPLTGTQLGRSSSRCFQSTQIVCQGRKLLTFLLDCTEPHTEQP